MSTQTSQIALITGASSGIGRAVAERLVGRGMRVILAARRIDRLSGLADQLGRLALPLALDVTDKGQIKQALAGLPEDFASPDCLINNAGLALGLGPAQDAEPDHWERMIATNCLGLASMTHALLPEMVRRRSGYIINIGSVAGTYPYPGANVYGATKAFVHQFSLALRSDLHGTGVRVTCLEPGMISGTEFSDVRFGGDRERARSVYSGVAALSAQDIAEIVEWVITRPPHVNLNVLEVMPTAQSWNGFQIDRTPVPA